MRGDPHRPHMSTFALFWGLIVLSPLLIALWGVLAVVDSIWGSKHPEHTYYE